MLCVARAVRPALGVATAAALLGCGGEPPTAAEITECLREGGAEVRLDPPRNTEPDEDFSPVLTPDTELAARGRLEGGSEFDLFVSGEDVADRAEERAIEFLRLFAVDRDHVLRRDTALLMVRTPEFPEGDRDLGERCLG